MDVKRVKAVYAAYSLDGSKRLASSSGGIYGLLAKRVLDMGGIVFAVCWDEQFETVHRKIEKAEDLPPSFGSKYVPSRLDDTFRLVKAQLQKGRTVLFAGTPCQTNGLRSFLGKDYGSLFLLDFICHGVPAKAAWRKYLRDHHLQGNLSSLSMRDKSSGWSRYRYSWRITTADGEQTCVPQDQVSFMKGFTRGLYLRPSCYACRFKGVERESDITLGDFWGVWDEIPEIDDHQGISAVFLHSEKGRTLFESVRDAMYCQAISADAVVKHNPSIINSAKLPENRVKFFHGINSGRDFDLLVETCCRETLAVRIKRKTRRVLQKILGEGIGCGKKGNEEAPALYKRKAECCGCTACRAVCPKAAISMTEDEEGFEYPQIEKSRCIGCGLCQKVCPLKERTK